MSPARRDGGFTLIEILAAMGILVVGVGSVLALLTFGAALQRTAEARNDVALAAAQVIAELREQSFPIASGGGAGAPDAGPIERDVPGHPRLRARVELKENPALPGEYAASVSIGWQERGKRRWETFRTILQREVPFTRRVDAELERARKRP